VVRGAKRSKSLYRSVGGRSERLRERAWRGARRVAFEVAVSQRRREEAGVARSEAGDV
jgi:hypothetical protein